MRQYLAVNLVSQSMPRGIYLLLRPPGQSRPRLALLCLPPELGRFGRARGYLGVGACPGGVAALLKPVVATEGDVVAVDSRGVRVNGELLPRSAPLARDREGRPLAVAWTGPAPLPPGTVFVVSTFTERSWDSRYWGPLPVSSLRARAVPLLLEEPLPVPLGPGSR
ncbi:MAG TPA: S26 family signal peptidase [Thermoanaerobaculia bacterium]|nr:S26 family signal peptidase [Thermoanaerobaculia bacterium]